MTGRSLLLVDDDNLVLATTSSGLKAAGYIVRTAQTVAEAIELLEEYRPDLALLDIRMGLQGGFDLAGNEVTWRSGASETSQTVSRIVSDVQDGEVRRLVFERKESGDTLRYTLETGPDLLVLQKDEVGADGVAQFRNRYALTRAVE